MSRKFTASRAKRKEVPLLIGLFGPAGSGKTYSALRLATGIRSITGGDIWLVGTENGRALHYAPLEGERADPARGTFDFMHVPLVAPFGSLDYKAAIRHCIAQGARIVITDSMSHEHEGEGGLRAAHEAELDRLAGRDWKKRDRVKFLAWVGPKADRQSLMGTILNERGASAGNGEEPPPVHHILCFRAKPKMELVKGQKEPTQLGYMPIGDQALVFEMTLSALLLPGANGCPEWNPPEPGSRQMIKHPGWTHSMLAKQLDESAGVKLAEWAAGGAVSPELAPSQAALDLVAQFGACADDAEYWAAVEVAKLVHPASGPIAQDMILSADRAAARKLGHASPEELAQQDATT